MDEARDEFLVLLQKQKMIREQRKRIEEVFEVKLKFGIVTKDPPGVWTVVTGCEENRKNAKEYVKSLCNPEETMVFQYPAELDEIVTSSQVHRRLEKTSHAAILFPGNSKAHILGSQLAVVMATSALEDLINRYKESSADDDQERITSNHSSNSIKLTEALNNKLSMHGDLDYTCDEKMPDAVKRVLLGWLVDENQDLSDEIKSEKTPKNYDSDLDEDGAVHSPSGKLSVTYTNDDMQTKLVEPSKVPEGIKQLLQDQRRGDYVAVKTPERSRDLIDLTADSPELPLYPLGNNYKGGDVADGMNVALPLSRKTEKGEDDKYYYDVVIVAKSKGYTTAEINEVIADYGRQLGCDEFLEALIARRKEKKRTDSPSDILQNMATVGIGTPTQFLPISPSSKQIVNRGQRPPMRKVQSGSDIQSDTVKSYVHTKSSLHQGSHMTRFEADDIELNVKNERPKVVDLTDDWVVVKPKARAEKSGIDAKKSSDSSELDFKKSLQIGDIPLRTDAINVERQREASAFRTKSSANEWSIVKPKSSESKKHGREVVDGVKHSGDVAAKLSRSPSPKRISLEAEKSGQVPAVQNSPNTLARDFDLSPLAHDARSTASNRPRKLRYIVIDGSNVAMSHGKSKSFSCRGIALCVDYFLKRGHREITAFVPQYRRSAPSPSNNITDQHILNELHERNFVTFTPSRRLEQKKKNIVCYDDRFIVRLAVETDGIIVSNDNYRDIMGDSREFREKIETGLLMFSFVGDLFMPPDDPLGRNGPNLDDFLSKPDPRPRPVPIPRKSLQNQWRSNSQPLVSQSLSTVPPVMYPQLLPRAQPHLYYSHVTGHPLNRMPVQGIAAPYTYSAPPVGHSQKLITRAPQTQMQQALGQRQPPQAPAQVTSSGQRSREETKELRNQLKLIFTGNDAQIDRILSNHPNENDLNKLSTYVLDCI